MRTHLRESSASEAFCNNCASLSADVIKTAKESCGGGGGGAGEVCDWIQGDNASSSGPPSSRPSSRNRWLQSCAMVVREIESIMNNKKVLYFSLDPMLGLSIFHIPELTHPCRSGHESWGPWKAHHHLPSKPDHQHVEHKSWELGPRNRWWSRRAVSRLLKCFRLSWWDVLVLLTFKVTLMDLVCSVSLQANKTLISYLVIKCRVIADATCLWYRNVK